MAKTCSNCMNWNQGYCVMWCGETEGYHSCDSWRGTLEAVGMSIFSELQADPKAIRENLKKQRRLRTVRVSKSTLP